MRASSTGLARPMGLVWEVGGTVVSACAHGGVKGRTRVTRGRDALARPGLVTACSCASWVCTGHARAGACAGPLGRW
jgi:hypothetical protein